MVLPVVSVLMPVRNMEQYIGEAIRSILNQTLANFEMIVIGDGCTDRSLQIAQGLGDPRIRVIELPPRARNGIHLALNEGLAEARGPYVARQDADDLSSQDRFKRQVDSLERDAACAAVGTAVEIIDAEGRPLHHFYPPPSDGEIRAQAGARTPFIHGSVMMRRSALEAVGGYRPFYRCEDFDLWLRLMDRFRLANLGEVLYRYRVHGHTLGRSAFHRQHWERRLALELSFQRRSGIPENRHQALIAVRQESWATLIEAERDYRAQLGNLLLIQGRLIPALREYLRAIRCRPLRWRSYASAAAALLGPRGSRVLRCASALPFNALPRPFLDRRSSRAENP